MQLERGFDASTQGLGKSYENFTSKIDSQISNYFVT